MKTVIALVATALLTGCSQTKALAPVGGDRLAEVRFATNDLLVAAHVDILTAPVCTASGAEELDISCVGRTIDNQPITATAKDGANPDLVVTVGAHTIYRGSVTDVLNQNARPTP